ncbi:hypothetical protein V502_05306 [Pseudogymnoascus sp. VKM F-4520 (FW-2644)]|nr:hypothetical protein V502_05306 [Pseudogymnoascus sp. VKM F-4520 (FW-2644)]
MPSPTTTALLLTFLVPLAIAAALYLLLTYALIPLYQRHHARYVSYLPLTAISTSTSSFRARVQASIAEYMLPAGWRTDFNAHQFAADSRSGSEAGDDAGEELYGFVAGRRVGVSLDARRGGAGGREEVSRLSRDLEEGFADDSSDDGEGIEREARKVLGDMQAHCLHHDQQFVLGTRYGKNDCQAISVAASLKIPARRYWKERLPSKLCRSFLEFSASYMERTITKQTQSRLPSSFEVIYMEGTITKQGLCRSFRRWSTLQREELYGSIHDAGFLDEPSGR